MRVFSLLLGLLLAVAAAAAGVAWLGYHTPPPPATLAVPGMTARAALRYAPDTPGAPPLVEVATLGDLWPALGAAQVQDHLWTMALWRQAARGRLAEWFGAGLLPVDRHTRRLGLDADARAAYNALTAPDRAALDGFARGVNAALTTRRAALDADLVLFRLAVEPWTGADVLAAERLAAWIATEVPLSDSLLADPAVARFATADRLLRDLLCADAFWQSRVLAYRAADGVHLTAQWMTGSSARPVFPTVRVRVGRDEGVATLLPGTPFPLAGRLGTVRWAVRPVGAGTLAAGADSTGRVVRETVQGKGGFVEDLPVVRAGDAVRVGNVRPGPLRPSSPPDTLAAPPADSSAAPGDSSAAHGIAAVAREAPAFWWLRWNGLAARTDAPAWLALWRGTARPTVLFSPAMAWTDGTALRLIGDATGDSAVAVLAPAGDAPVLARRLAQLVGSPGLVPEDDATSLWAARLGAALVPRLLRARLATPQEREGYQYVRNWTYGYSSADIAPTLFEAWLDEIDRRQGMRGDSLVADTGVFSDLRYTESFRAAVARVARAYGDDPRGWRWGLAHPATRHFPLASVAHRLALVLPASERYTPLRLPGGTHPTTLAFQPGDALARATAGLELRLAPDPTHDLLRMLPPPSGVLAPYRSPERPLAFSLRTPLGGLTTLTPSP